MKNKAYEKFDRAMREIISVPHSAIKRKLDAEKRSKAAKKRKPASGAARGDRAKGT